MGRGPKLRPRQHPPPARTHDAAGAIAHQHAAGRLLVGRGRGAFGPLGGLDRDADQRRADSNHIPHRGVELRGGDVDEAPQAYRRLPDVLAAHAGTIRVLHTLRPLGVAMAGRGIVDPYKD